MKFFLALISSNQGLCGEFVRRRQNLFPMASLPKYFQNGVQIDVAAFTPGVSPGTPESFLCAAAKKADVRGLLVLVQNDFRSTIADIESALFATEILVPDVIESPQNYLGMHLSRMFKNFANLAVERHDADVDQMCTLPLRNFEAPDLAELARLYRNETNLGTFTHNCLVELAEIKKRKQPRRDSSYKHKYFIDDGDKHFIYGLENHSLFATGHPHKPSCEITGNFRFGLRTHARRHFNVSKGRGDVTSIEGSFPDCHGVICPVAKTTHLNMFCNDYF